MIGFNENIIKRLSVELGKSDKEIADFFQVDRTTILKQREKYGIKKKQTIGRLGEKYVMSKLLNKGYAVEDMNELDKTAAFDLLVDGFIRIEVKTASACNKNGLLYYHFTFANKEECNNAESETRIRLKNGRTVKLYRKTCDFIVCIGIDNKKAAPFIFPSNYFKDGTQTVAIPVEKTSSSEYYAFKNKWSLLELKKKPDAPTSDIKKNIC